MNPKQLFVAAPVALLVFMTGAASAAQTVNEAGALACINDKWDEKEVEKGHKLVDFAGRCVAIPDGSAAPKYTEECVGKYEFMPDESWKGNGSCTYTYKDSPDKVHDTYEEGSHLKESTYTYHRRHRQISGRHRRRYLHARDADRHARRRQVQGHDGIALTER